MGLDNGIIIEKMKREDVPRAAAILKNKDSKEEFAEEIEVCYWRKQWGIRGEIIDILKSNTNTNDTFKFPVKKENIPDIIAILLHYLNKEYYEDNARTIWSYDETVYSLGGYVGMLCWLYEYMKEYPELEVYFYDSY